jgi:hypothetical protein
MSFSGNVSSMALDEVFGFLAGNALEGVLAVTSGSGVSQRLFFKDGMIFFPPSSRRGTYSLGKILRHTGVLSREGLGSLLDEMSAKRKELAGQEDSEGVLAAKRLQFTEEVHDLFLWGDARFEFKPGSWPPRVQQDREADRGLMIETTSLLMEVARRADERRRIRASIPSSRFLLVTVEGSEQAVIAGLRDAKIDVQSSPFDGSLSLDDQLERWGIPHHEALAAVALLVEAGHVVPVTADATRAQIRELLQGTDLEHAARLLGHWVELNRRHGEGDSLGLEQEFVTSKAFVSGPEEVTALRLRGPRVFTLLRVLVALGNPITLVLHHHGWEKRIAVLPGEIYVRNDRRDLAPTPTLAEYLQRAGAIDKKTLKAITSGKETRPIDELVDAQQLGAARLARLIDELAEIVFWGRTDVELRNRSVRGSEDTALVAALGPAEREQLHDGLETWAGVFDKVPGDDCLFVPGWGTKGSEKDPAARFFKRFGLHRNVGELRRRAQATCLEFAQFVHRGLERGYIRPPSKDELKAALVEAGEAKNDVVAYRLVNAALAQGIGDDFEELLERLRQDEAALPGAFPALEGDLDGVGLGAVLQALQQHRRTGTLSVTAGRREEKLFFSRGEAFILRVEDSEADDFVNFFLGDDGAEQVSELGSGLASSGLVNEDELSEAEINEIKGSFLDVLLWEGSTFTFFQNELPDEFFNPDQGVSKVALKTGRFLLEAMQTVTEYEQLCELIGTSRTILAFVESDGKLKAISSRGHPQVLTLVDGRLSFDDIVRISGAQRLDVARIMAGLIEEGALKTAGEKPTVELPDAVPD